MKLLIALALILGLALPAHAGPTADTAVTSGNNSAGLTLVLACSNEAHVTGVAVAGANATVNFDISIDTVTWRTHTVLLAAASGEATISAMVGQPFVRITSATTAVALDYELGCKQ